MKRKREEEEVASSAASVSSRTLFSPASNKMDEWLAAAEIYEPIYLSLLGSIVTKEYTRIGRRYDCDFWNAFTDELNKRIRAALVNNTTVKFSNFSTANVCCIADNLRAKFHKYKNTPESLNDFVSFQRCFMECDTCSHMPMIPTKYTSRKCPIQAFQSTQYNSGIKGRVKVVDVLLKLYEDEENNLSSAALKKATKFFNKDGGGHGTDFFLAMKKPGQLRFIRDL